MFVLIENISEEAKKENIVNCDMTFKSQVCIFSG